MERVRSALQTLATEEPVLRRTLLGLTRQADKWNSLPPGWTQESVKKFWESLTGENKHKVTKCIKEMEGKVDDPGAFCASLADKVMGPEWRSKKAIEAALTHDQAVLKLLKENPDWPKGDLLDAIGTTSPRPSLETQKVQNRYWELRGGRRGPMPGEYDYRKRAVNSVAVSTAALPPVLKRVLAEVRFNKRKITVNLRTSFTMYAAGDDGAKGFTALVDIDTNQYQVVWGAFGGGALGQKPSPVDDVNTPTKPLPDHLVVVQGQVGGRDPYASITCTSAALPRLTGAETARLANGDMLQYFADNPDKLAEKLERDKAKKNAGIIDHLARRYLAANYTSLAGAAVITEDPRYGKGSTEVWYAKSRAARDLLMGSRFVMQHGTLPDPANLDATHIFLGYVDENNPNKVFDMMQGEVWSPNGEARALVSRIGHTSMMVGDIVVVHSRPLMVDSSGFFDLQKQSKVAFNKFNAPELVSQLLAVLAQEGLDDALNQIKMKKVPELVAKAWASRGKTASEETQR